MFDFLLLCLASASLSTALPLRPLQAVLQFPPKMQSSQQHTLYTLFQQIRESETPRTVVGVLLKSSSSLDVPSQYFEFPLGEKISPVEFPMLPLHPSHARIINTTMRTEAEKEVLSVQSLRNIICLAYPKVEDAGVESSLMPSLHKTVDVQPLWWLAKDDEVDFEAPWGRWYLAGQEVESYECI